MTLALHSEEREIVEAVIWFANLKSIRTTQQVEKRFSRLSYVKEYFQILKPEEVEAYRDDQECIRGWLQKISKSQRERREVEKIIQDKMKQVSDAKLVFKQGTISYQYILHGVEAVMALGVALILDKKKEITSRLKQCGNPNCMKFNLEFNPKGRPRKYCNTECKKLYDNLDAANRTRRYRLRMKK